MRASTQRLQKKLRAAEPAAPLSLPGGLSTGVTLINLACSGRASWGLSRGHLYLFVGDAESGKTVLALTTLAEAAASEAFADYQLIYDAPEFGALMDLQHFFGARLTQRLQAPRQEDGVPQPSGSVEELLFNLDDAFESGRPFVYVLDSFDALEALSEQETFDKNKKLHRAGSELKASYGMARAKAMSNGLRRVVSRLERTQSIVIMLAQTRDNVDPWAHDKKTRAGGRALRFYSTIELWTSIKGKITRDHKDKVRDLGIYINVEIRKNRQNGRHPRVVVPFYHSFGLDDLGASVDYLVDERVWKKTAGVIEATDFAFKGPREKLIAWIEAQHKEKALRALAAQTWEEIEEACRVERKRRYT